MHWFQSLDVALFRWVNLGWSNPVFDTVMPFISGSELSRSLFFSLAVLGAIGLLWKGGARGWVCLLMLALVLAVGDGAICNTLKHAVGRARPFWDIPETHCLAGKSGSGSMPSSHAANWFSALMVLLIYYRRTIWFMLPGAVLVGLSRVYNGVHYPSDVLAGAILGAGYAAAICLAVNAAWGWVGRTWFPLWWEKLPSLLNPVQRGEEAEEEPRFAPRKKGGAAQAGPPAVTRHATVDEHWLRLGYICIGLFLVARWAYIASGTIQLAEDEAYQWLWSKHLALSYFSKPPLIAYAQFLGTHLWGDTAFGIRFLSPVITAVMGLVLLRFFAREVNARAGFFLLFIATATPLLSLGAVLMTVDPWSVLFWTAAMLAGWKAIQEKSTTKDWCWVGLWMGLGFLSKYTELFQLLSWVLVFVLWAPARKQLRRPGPYLALLINAVSTLPVVIWNASRGWITAKHVAADGGAYKPWEPTLKFFGDFLGMEFGLMNPVFFVAALWAAIVFWRRYRHNPKLVYFFSMGAPVFLAYTALSFHSRILPNWIAPSVIPMFCLMVIYWDTQLRLGQSRVKGWLVAGLVIGAIAVPAAHNTDVWKATLPVRRVLAVFIPDKYDAFAAKFTAKYLPVNWDPLHRVRVWSEVAQTIGEARRELEASDGKPTFIIAEHYGITSQTSFYLPEAKARVTGTPLVYFRSTEHPDNQFGFWLGYECHRGENAIYVRELDRVKPNTAPPPRILERLQSEFESVTEIGVRNVMYHGNVCRPLQFFACRGLK
jgi:membrane-associated phospholipid phosphatase